MSLSPSADRSDTLTRLYNCLAALTRGIDGPYYLRNCTGEMEFPDRGLYFFFSPGTDFEAPPSEWRITRIGTVGVAEGSSSSLWNRLRQHRGNISGKYGEHGGNSRGSIFRTHIGRAMIERDGLADTYPHWGEMTADLPDTQTVRANEHQLERRISTYIRSLPFLYVAVNDEPGPSSDRAYLEKNLIALVAQERRGTPNAIESDWLGYFSPRPEINRTGLWNLEHVTGLYSPSAITTLDEYISATEPARQ